MRVSQNPDDKGYSPTAEKRRVWVNDKEIVGWETADEFRRVVVGLDHKVYNGSVRIERLEEDNPQIKLLGGPAALPADVGFAGAGLVFDKPNKPEHPEHPEHPEKPEHPVQSQKPPTIEPTDVPPVKVGTTQV